VRALLVVLALVVGACGGTASGPGDDDYDDDYDYAEETEPPDSASGGGSGSRAVDELLKKRRAATFKVVYEWSGSGSLPLSETWYQKPPKSRVDFGTPGEARWTSQFILADGMYLCETSRGTSTCWKGGGGAEAPEDLSFAATIMLAYEGLLDDPAFTSERETRTIAGQQASCWKSSSLAMLGLAQVTLCHASNGVPLHFEWKAGNDTFAMTAKSYSTTVADSELELLAKPDN